MQSISFIAAALAVLALAISGGQAERVSYAGYALYRSTPNTQYQVDKLIEIMNEGREVGVEFWKEPNIVNGTVDMMVSSEAEADLREKLRHIRVPTKKIMHDIEEVILRVNKPALSLRKTLRNLELNNENVTRGLREVLEPSYFYTKYSRYSMIEAKLQDMADKNPRVTKEIIGKSYEGRQLYLYKVSTDPSANKRVIFLDAGHHAREWISHVTLLYIMESLISDNMPTKTVKRPRVMDLFNSTVTNEIDLGEDMLKALSSGLKSQLESYDFWFIPVVNPDGYEYSHTTDRLWRKTKSRQSSMCTGADPNRNYAYHWNEAGASSFSCSEIYAGVKPASEPEVAAVSKALYDNKDRIDMYVSLHAYSQLLLSPYGYGQVYPDNYANLQTVANKAINTIRQFRGKEYRFGVSSIILYPAAGGSDDYAHGACGIKYAYTWELPDTGNYGFILPESEIIPTAQETVLGLNAMIDTMKDLNRKQNNGK